ncbi:unnamed protein product [Triticum turgidum subsp. durum]|uniref:DELLA protein n=1 Tax=Triticum turgidum subsp. durum TaxID=4567 RepID=A0A9R0SHM2_TRITD|nr:unnamed protein product [Triticum turgidum subsp. durum]
MKREYQDAGGSGGGGGMGSSEDKMMVSAAAGEGEEVDELLAALGYKVRASDMADVAQKLEQLEMAMGMGGVGAGAAPDDSFATHLATDTVHYNPTDLSSWVESMLSELNAPPPPLPPAPQQLNASTSSTVTGGGYFDLPPSVDSSCSTYALRPIPSPAGAVGPADLSADSVRDPKRMRTGGSSTSSSSSSSSSLGGGARSSVVEAAPPVAAGANAPALPVVVVDTQEAGIRLVHALLACAEAVQQENFSAAEALVKQIPLLAASQGGAMRKVAAYFGEALARRVFRFRPQPDSSLLDAAFADLLHAHFYESCPYLKFAHFTANQAILEAFARLLAQPGALEKVLGTVRAVRPRIVTVVEQEANHNSGTFLDRFTESLHYYSTMFDSLEGGSSGGPSEVSSGAAAAPAAAGTDQVMSEVYLGRQICNVVACEGAERTERHETLGQWRNRLGNAGFETVHLGSNAYKQASTLLALFAGGDGYKVEEKEGCLTLGWHTRPLIATSAWRLAAP